MNFVYFNIINLIVIFKFNNFKINLEKDLITNKRTRIKYNLLL